LPCPRTYLLGTRITHTLNIISLTVNGTHLTLYRFFQWNRKTGSTRHATQRALCYIRVFVVCVYNSTNVILVRNFFFFHFRCFWQWAALTVYVRSTGRRLWKICTKNTICTHNNIYIYLLFCRADPLIFVHVFINTPVWPRMCACKMYEVGDPPVVEIAPFERYLLRPPPEPNDVNHPRPWFNSSSVACSSGSAPGAVTVGY